MSYFQESKNIEYKKEVPANSEKYLKTIIAFANGNGEQLIFGIEDESCQIIGIEQDTIFATADRITNAIADSIQPMADFEIKYQTIEGKTIIIVQVFPGTRRPYHFKAKGLLDGTYIRISGTTRKADDFVVKELIFQGENKCYDQTAQFNQIITKEEINTLCNTMYEYALSHCAFDAEKSEIKRVEEKT